LSSTEARQDTLIIILYTKKKKEKRRKNKREEKICPMKNRNILISHSLILIRVQCI